MGAGEAVLRVLKLIISVYDLLTSWAYNIAANAGLKVKLYSRVRAAPTAPIREGDTQVGCDWSVSATLSCDWSR